MRFQQVAAVAALLTLSGCKPIEDWMAGQVAGAMAKETEQLRAEMKQLKTSITSLEERLKKLTNAVEFNDKWNDATRNMYREQSASISSDCEKYGVARTELGPVIIACDSVSPYLDGFKIKLLVSVLVPIEVVGLKVKAGWLETEERFQEKDRGMWREKEVEALSSFYPARYTSVEVPLTPASAAGIKSLTISAKASQVSITRQPSNEQKR